MPAPCHGRATKFRTQSPQAPARLELVVACGPCVNDFGFCSIKTWCFLSLFQVKQTPGQGGCLPDVFPRCNHARPSSRLSWSWSGQGLPLLSRFSKWSWWGESGCESTTWNGSQAPGVVSGCTPLCCLWWTTFWIKRKTLKSFPLYSKNKWK